MQGAAVGLNHSAPAAMSLTQAQANTLVLTISPPAQKTRAALDLCCVIDVSGSMGIYFGVLLVFKYFFIFPVVS